MSIRLQLPVLRKDPPLFCGLWQAASRCHVSLGHSFGQPSLHFYTCKWKITTLMSHIFCGKKCLQLPNRRKRPF